MRPARTLAPALATAVLTAAASVALWAWLGRAVPLPDVTSGRLQCLSYALSHGDASPLDADFATPPGMLRTDMQRLKTITGCIRTYSSLGSQGDAVAAAAEAGLEVLVGIWISADDEANAAEIGRALELAAAYPHAVRAIVVGNEVLLRREMSGRRLAAIIRAVKARAGHPVTYADIFEFWRRNPAVAEAVDLVTVHVLPYWDDPTPVGIDAVQDHVRGIVARARSTFPGKPLQIGEIGWPSAGRTRGGAAPSPVNAARFLREFAGQADSLGVAYNVIEAIDQPWKRLPEGTVGGHWGVLDRDRHAKFALAGPVSAWPRWPWAAVFTICGMALAVAVALFRHRPLSFARWSATAATGAATAGLLWAFGDQARSAAIGIAGMAWFGYLGLLTVAGGAIAAGRAAGWLPLPQAWLGVYRWLVLVPAAMVALALAVDGRHRDFLTLAFLMPAVALAVTTDGPGRRPAIGEGWLGLVLLVGGPLAIDSPANREAIAWAACCLLLAFSLRARIVAECRRLAAVLRQYQAGGDDRDD